MKAQLRNFLPASPLAKVAPSRTTRFSITPQSVANAICQPEKTKRYKFAENEGLALVKS